VWHYYILVGLARIHAIRLLLSTTLQQFDVARYVEERAYTLLSSKNTVGTDVSDAYVSAINRIAFSLNEDPACVALRARLLDTYGYMLEQVQAIRRGAQGMPLAPLDDVVSEGEINQLVLFQM
jgi:hypothetical protein